MYWGKNTSQVEKRYFLYISSTRTNIQVKCCHGICEGLRLWWADHVGTKLVVPKNRDSMASRFIQHYMSLAHWSACVSSHLFLIKILETEVPAWLDCSGISRPGRAYMMHSDHPQMGCRQFSEDFSTEPGKHMKQKRIHTGQGLWWVMIAIWLGESEREQAQAWLCHPLSGLSAPSLNPN